VDVEIIAAPADSMKLPRLVSRSAALLALALALFLSGCAGVEYSPAGVTRLRPTPGKGLVVFYREDRFLGSEVGYKVRDGFAVIGGLRNGTFFAHQADPGRHFYNASTEVANQVVLDVAAGRTYYVRCGVRPGVVIWRPTLHSVPRSVGEAALEGLRPVQLPPKKE
jgi:hypothetical protein